MAMSFVLAVRGIFRFLVLFALCIWFVPFPYTMLISIIGVAGLFVVDWVESTYILIEDDVTYLEDDNPV